MSIAAAAIEEWFMKFKWIIMTWNGFFILIFPVHTLRKYITCVLFSIFHTNILFLLRSLCISYFFFYFLYENMWNIYSKTFLFSSLSLLCVLTQGATNFSMGYEKSLGVLFRNAGQKAWSTTFVYCERSGEWGS